jgi:hypothetical protein
MSPAGQASKVSRELSLIPDVQLSTQDPMLLVAVADSGTGVWWWAMVESEYAGWDIGGYI